MAIDQRKREHLRHEPKFHSQFSLKARKGSRAHEILMLLTKHRGDRIAVFDEIKDNEWFRRQTGGMMKTDTQLKWQIAQVAWRFGFKKR